jgi:tricorn protease-like protein
LINYEVRYSPASKNLTTPTECIVKVPEIKRKCSHNQDLNERNLVNENQISKILQYSIFVLWRRKSALLILGVIGTKSPKPLCLKESRVPESESKGLYDQRRNTSVAECNLPKLALISLMVLLFTVSVSPMSEGLNNYGKIAFASTRDKTGEIYVMTGDGENQMRITNDPVWNSSPSWSPDGTRIAFGRGDGEEEDWEIYIMNADGTNLKQLTNNAFWDNFPSWSPEGTKIAFCSKREGGKEIYIMNTDGKNQISLTNSSRSDSCPAWSPDGTRIAFDSCRDENWEIYIMNTDGKNQINLTNNPAQDTSPAWSPDGTKIAFNSDRDDGNSDIYVMNIDGTNVLRLTDDTAYDLDPAWSPDGKKIAFFSDRSIFSWDEIYVMDADGSNVKRLTHTFYCFNIDPAWCCHLHPEEEMSETERGTEELSKAYSLAVVTVGAAVIILAIFLLRRRNQ